MQGPPWQAQNMLGMPGQTPPRSTDPVPIHDLLSGGNPRTLHNVDEVIRTVLAQPERVDELIRCVLDADDDIVRMRAGDARQDPAIVDDLRRQLALHEQSSHKSLASRARKLSIEFGHDSHEASDSRLS
jgi:hypothetical protein